MKKTSKANFVVLLGIAAIMSGCGASAETDQTAKRNIYKNKADCIKEWGADKCNDTVSNGPNRGGFYGPFFFPYMYPGFAGGGTSAMASVSSATGSIPKGAAMTGGVSNFSSARSAAIARGGFGSSAAGHSSGSGS